MRRRSAVGLFGLVPVLLIGLAGCSAGPGRPATPSPVPTALIQPLAQARVAAPSTAPSTAPVPSARPGGGTALAALATLAVKGRAPRTGYSREAFGPAWADTDRNGCDTRNDILNRDLTARTHKAGTGGCAVLSGTLADPYTASTIAFRRGATTSTTVQIDHVVALSNAWQTGAAALDAATRLRFANDPLELLAVQGASNQAKSDADAATWLPPSKRYRCAYVARQVAVKAKYALWVTPAEKAAVARVLATCPDQPLGSAAGPTQPLPTPAAPAAVPAPPVPRSPAPESAVSAPAYPNCGAARAAGVTPLHRGEPGYSDHLDRDHDGVACE